MTRLSQLLARARSYLLLLSIVFTGCAAAGAESAIDNNSRLAGTQWRLQHIQSMNDEVFIPAVNAVFSLTFSADGRVAIQADCNRGSGEYNEAGSQLEFGVIASTRAMCPPDSLHDRFLSDLEFVRSFVLADGDLHLATMADGAILTFAPVLDSEGEALIAPGFDCAGASGTVENLLCSNAELALLDRQLNTIYGLAEARFSAAELTNLRAMQRGWISGRNDCWKESPVDACVREATQRRLSELQIRTGSVRVPEVVLFDCPPNRMLETYFYNNTVLPMLVLNEAGNQVFMHQLIAASGGRYGIGNTEFWERGDEAQFSEFSETVRCERR